MPSKGRSRNGIAFFHKPLYQVCEAASELDSLIPRLGFLAFQNLKQCLRRGPRTDSPRNWDQSSDTQNESQWALRGLQLQRLRVPLFCAFPKELRLFHVSVRPSPETHLEIKIQTAGTSACCLNVDLASILVSSATLSTTAAWEAWVVETN